MNDVSITLPREEWKLIAELLKMAGEEFGNHGCNDMPEELAELLPEKRRLEICREMSGEDDADFDPGDDGLMGYYGELIDDATPLASGETGGGKAK